MKKCPRCGKEKEASPMRSSYCRQCRLAYQQAWQGRNAVTLRLKRRASAGQRRIYYARWYRLHGRTRKANYREIINEWMRTHPEAVRAQRMLQGAVRTGQIVRPPSCTDCRRHTRLHAHHEDYRKPLEVIWLCASCHKLRHTKKKT